MRWLDYFGLPGVGKSTIVDPLPKPPTGHIVAPPLEWADFLDCVYQLLPLTDWHPTGHVARQAIKTAIRVTAAVHAHDDPGTVVHRCFAHRGLSIAYRLRDVGDVREFYRLMPLSVGVVWFRADMETVRLRNAARGDDKFYMAAKMQEGIEIALEEFGRRGVTVHELDTTRPVDETRKDLERWATPLNSATS